MITKEGMGTATGILSIVVKVFAYFEYIKLGREILKETE
jgi:hypothetical protein